jgi:hypothetical protein
VREQKEQTIHAVVFKGRDWWVIQFLEYDLATQVRCVEDAPAEIRRFLLVQMLASAEHGLEPFAGFSKAPRRFWEMYDRAKATIAPIRLPEPGSFSQIETRVAA